MIKILNVLILAALSLGRETAWSTAMIPLAVFHPKLWSLHRIGGAAEWTGVCGQHYCDKVDCMLTGWRGYWVMGVQTTVCRWWGALLLARVTSIHYASRNLARVTASSILTSHINDWWLMNWIELWIFQDQPYFIYRICIFSGAATLYPTQFFVCPLSINKREGIQTQPNQI